MASPGHNELHYNIKHLQWAMSPGEHHDDVINWKHFPRYWPFVRGIHRSPVNSRRKGQWRGALMFCMICAWINGWVNPREAADLRLHRAHYDVTVMISGAIIVVPWPVVKSPQLIWRWGTRRWNLTLPDLQMSCLSDLQMSCSDLT